MFETVDDYGRKKYDTGKVQPKWLSRAMLVTSIVSATVFIFVLLSLIAKENRTWSCVGRH
jgi:hypothetical protein